MHVAAGYGHTVLLRSDGAAVACGNIDDGQCDMPDLDEDYTIVQASAGWGHTVLLRSDGVVLTCGDHDDGQCNIPALVEGLVYRRNIVVSFKYKVLQALRWSCSQVYSHGWGGGLFS